VTLRYQTRFEIADELKSDCSLELDRVGDSAVVRLNDRDLRPRFWAPFRRDVADTVRQGRNQLSVGVTGSLVNQYEPKNARPSGLFGPVLLRVTRTGSR
jgi:hypothetical protein